MKSWKSDIDQGVNNAEINNAFFFRLLLYLYNIYIIYIVYLCGVIIYKVIILSIL